MVRRGREAKVGREERLLVRVVRLSLCVLLVLGVLGVGDAEPVAAAAKGWVFAMPGTKTATKIAGRVIVHVYPADRGVAGVSTLDPSLSAGGKKNSVAAMAELSRGSRGEVAVDLGMFRCFNRRGESGPRRLREKEGKQPGREAGKPKYRNARGVVGELEEERGQNRGGRSRCRGLLLTLRLCADTHRLVASSGRAMPGDDNPFDAILQPRHGLLTPVKVTGNG